MLPFDASQAIAHLRAADRTLGHLIDRVGEFGLTLSDPWSPFQHLVHSVIFQQISKHAGLAIQTRLWDLFGGAPDPADISNSTVESLRAVGLSRNKVATIQQLAHSALEGNLPEKDILDQMDNEAITELLTRHKGIGPWTAQMVLIFHLGRPDVLPATDLGVRRGFKIAFGEEELPSVAALKEYGRRWKPWRSVASWYLWRANDL